jgi:hypothetical protein
MLFKKCSDRPKKHGKYITNVGPCYFQGTWKWYKGLAPAYWLDEDAQPWLSMERDGVPDPNIPLIAFIFEKGVQITATYTLEGKFLISGLDKVHIADEVTHYMYQVTPPEEFMVMLLAAEKTLKAQEAADKLKEINSPITEPTE